MYVINITEELLTFQYQNKAVALKPEGVMEINGFDHDNIGEVPNLIKLGFLQYCDEEEDEQDFIIPYDLNNNLAKVKKAIAAGRDKIYRNIYFEEDIDF